MARSPAEGNSSPILETAKPELTPCAGIPTDFPDLYVSAMDRALGIEKASLSAIVGLHSSALDMYQDVLSFAPAVYDVWGAAMNAFAFFVESQFTWMSLMLPYVGGETLLAAAAPNPRLALHSQARIPEALAHSMDIAIGTGSEDSVAAAVSTSEMAAVPERQDRPAEALENSMDAALGVANAA